MSLCSRSVQGRTSSPEELVHRLPTLTGRTSLRLRERGAISTQIVSPRSRAVPFPTSSRTSRRPPTASQTTSAPHNPFQGSCGALFVVPAGYSSSSRSASVSPSRTRLAASGVIGSSPR